jgi:hypothetical protein
MGEIQINCQKDLSFDFLYMFDFEEIMIIKL